MRKLLAAVLALTMSAASMAGCNKQQEFVDGTYTARFEEYDSRGYRDYLVVTVENGAITAVEFDGLNESGGRKTQDEDLRRRMEPVQGRYPAEINPNLENQLLAGQGEGGVDIVAGATYSTESFEALYDALVQSIYKGDTTELVLENIPEK